jgi:hypothetical protein
VLLCGSCLVASTELIQKLPGYEQLPSGYGCVAIQNINDIGSLTERLAAIAEDPEPAAEGPTPGPSHIVAFVHSDGAQRSPLLVDDVTARILQLSDGTRTALQIARQSTAQRRVSAIEERLEWIENLFRRGLIGLLDPDIERSQTCRAHIKRKRATVARR